MHPSQRKTFGSVIHMCFYPPFGAQNAIVGQSTMANSMTNAVMADNEKCTNGVTRWIPKKTQHNHYGPPQQQDITYGRNDSHKRSSTTYGCDNYQDKRSRMIADDHPREIAPTPRCTSQVITTETVHHSMKIKINTRQLARLPLSTQHHIKISNTWRVT
jgi:hypothetical protein